jgi:hypothetical protein
VVALRRTTLWLALAAVGWYLGLRILGQVLPADSPLRQWPEPFWDLQGRASQSLYVWTALLAILGWEGLPRSPVPLAAVLHRGDLSLVHAAPEPDHRAVVLAQAAAAGPVAGTGPAAGGTVGGCLLIHELLIRRVRWLRPLFGLRAIRRRRQWRAPR